MKTHSIYESVFEGLRTTESPQQTCLVAVNDGSVVVYPMEKRLADIRRKAWQSGFKCGLLAFLALLLLMLALYATFWREDFLRRLQGFDAFAVVETSPVVKPAGQARPGSKVQPSAKSAQPDSPVTDWQDEQAAIAQGHAALRAVSELERLLYVGTYDRYDQLLPVVKRVAGPDRALVIRSNKLRSGKYLLLVQPRIGDDGFEAARSRVSRLFGEALLKWNTAKRYLQLLD